MINNDNNSEKNIQIPMINHLRDALVSNMIGVLTLLKEKRLRDAIVMKKEDLKVYLMRRRCSIL